MENIGANFKKELLIKTVKSATKFEFLQAVINPLSHIIKAEVTVFDFADDVLGGAFWIQLNPLPDGEGGEIDNWSTLVNKTLKQLKNLAKNRLKEMALGR